MNYQAFKKLFEDTSAGAGFPIHLPEEVIDVAQMERSYKAYAHRFESSAGPFHTGLEYAWRWDALLSARSQTTEEDFIHQVWDDERGRLDTDRPVLRLDTRLFATCGDKRLATPSPSRFKRWQQEIGPKLESLLPCDYPAPGSDLVVPIAGRVPPSVELELSEKGPLLRSVAIESFQLITLPRQWDDPSREDPNPEGQLHELFDRVTRAFDVWVDHLHVLADV